MSSTWTIVAVNINSYLPMLNWLVVTGVKSEVQPYNIQTNQLVTELYNRMDGERMFLYWHLRLYCFLKVFTNTYWTIYSEHADVTIGLDGLVSMTSIVILWPSFWEWIWQVLYWQKVYIYQRYWLLGNDGTM